MLKENQIKKSLLIEKLFDILEEKGRIEEKDIENLSKELKIVKNEIKAIISFYKEFSEIKNKNAVYVCFGISCLEKGSRKLYEELQKQGFDVRKSYCFKKCAQAPVVKFKDRFILNQKMEYIINIKNPDVKNLERNISFNSNVNGKIKIRRCVAGNCLHKDVDLSGFDVENCGCLGFCGFAPVGIIDNKVFQLSPTFLNKIKQDPTIINRENFLNFDRKGKIIMKYNDFVDPFNIDSYIKIGGFEGIKKAVELGKERIIEIAKEAGIRGRGGAAFPLHIKLQGVMQQKENPKFVVANLEEGEVASYCNVILAESNPFIIIEGIIIAAYVVGATKGYIFVNYKAKEAIERLKNVIKQAKDMGFFNFVSNDFDIEIRRSPSAYIAGEETAMLEVIEGKKAMPRNRPPFPFQQGLFGKPTLINNVETLAALACAVSYGPEVFKEYGKGQSIGTKMISLTGNVNNPCVNEVPYGIKVRKIIEEIGFGFREPNKGLLIGGPSGGILTNSSLDLDYTYEDIQREGAMLGSGAIFAIPNSMSIPELVRDLMQFFADESCGQCIPCRVGTVKLTEKLNDFLNGKNLDRKIDEIIRTVMNASLCGLGQAAPIPLITAMKNFPREFSKNFQEVS